MNIKQIKWAQAHDWFISSTDDSVTVRDEFDPIESKNITFTDFKSLYIWAGY